MLIVKQFVSLPLVMSGQSRLEIPDDVFRLHPSLRIMAREVSTPSLSLLINITPRTRTHHRLLGLLLGSARSLVSLLIFYASEPHKVAQVRTRLCSLISHHHSLLGIPNKKLNATSPRHLRLHRSLLLEYRFPTRKQRSTQSCQPVRCQLSYAGKIF